MTPVILHLPVAVARPLFWVIEHKAAYLVTHAIIGLLLALEAWKCVRLTVAAKTLLPYFGCYLLAAVATWGVCICLARIYARSRR